MIITVCTCDTDDGRYHSNFCSINNAITLGSRVTFGSGDPKYDPVGVVTYFSGDIASVSWPTHDNECFLSDLRLVA